MRMIRQGSPMLHTARHYGISIGSGTSIGFSIYFDDDTTIYLGHLQHDAATTYPYTSFKPIPGHRSHHSFSSLLYLGLWLISLDDHSTYRQLVYTHIAFLLINSSAYHSRHSFARHRHRGPSPGRHSSRRPPSMHLSFKLLEALPLAAKTSVYGFRPTTSTSTPSELTIRHWA